MLCRILVLRRHELPVLSNLHVLATDCECRVVLDFSLFQDRHPQYIMFLPFCGLPASKIIGFIFFLAVLFKDIVMSLSTLGIQEPARLQAHRVSERPVGRNRLHPHDYGHFCPLDNGGNEGGCGKKETSAVDRGIFVSGQEMPTEDRILKNWVVPLAVFRTLKMRIGIALSPHDLLNV